MKTQGIYKVERSRTKTPAVGTRALTHKMGTHTFDMIVAMYRCADERCEEHTYLIDVAIMKYSIRPFLYADFQAIQLGYAGFQIFS